MNLASRTSPERRLYAHPFSVALLLCLLFVTTLPRTDAQPGSGLYGGSGSCGNAASQGLCTRNSTNAANCTQSPLNCSFSHSISPTSTTYLRGGQYGQQIGCDNGHVVQSICIANATFNCSFDLATPIVITCSRSPIPEVPNFKACGWRYDTDTAFAYCYGDEIMQGVCVGSTGLGTSLCTNSRPRGQSMVYCCLTYGTQCSNADYMVRSDRNISRCNWMTQSTPNTPQMAVTGVCSNNCDAAGVFGAAVAVPFMFYCQSTFFVNIGSYTGSVCATRTTYSTCSANANDVVVGITAQGCTAGRTRAVCSTLRHSWIRTESCVIVQTNSSMLWCPNGYAANWVCANNGSFNCPNGSTTALQCCLLFYEYQGGLPCPVHFVYSATGGFRSTVTPSGFGSMVATAVSVTAPSKFTTTLVLDVKYDLETDSMYWASSYQGSSLGSFATAGFGVVGRAPMGTGQDPTVQHMVGSLTQLGYPGWGSMNSTGFFTAVNMSLMWTSNIIVLGAIGIDPFYRRLYVVQGEFITQGNMDGPFWQRIYAGIPGSPGFTLNPQGATCVRDFVASDSYVRCNSTGLYRATQVVYRVSTSETFIAGMYYILREYQLNLAYYVGNGQAPTANYPLNADRTSVQIGRVNTMLIWQDSAMYITDDNAGIVNYTAGVTILDLSNGTLNRPTFNYEPGVPKIDTPHGMVLYRSGNVYDPLIMYLTDYRDGILKITLNNMTVSMFAGISKSDNAGYVDRVFRTAARFVTPKKLAVSRTQLYIADTSNGAIRAIILSPCTIGFNASERCLKCDSGWYKYPVCRQTCTLQDDCLNRATSVSGYQSENVTCICACYFMFRGATCNSCKKGFDPNFGCTKCWFSQGFVGRWPNCRTISITISVTPSRSDLTLSGTASFSESMSQHSEQLSMSLTKPPPPTKSKTPPPTPTRTRSRTRAPLPTETVTRSASSESSLSQTSTQKFITPIRKWRRWKTATATATATVTTDTGSFSFSQEGSATVTLTQTTSLSLSIATYSASATKKHRTFVWKKPLKSLTRTRFSPTTTFTATNSLPSRTIPPTATKPVTTMAPPTPLPPDPPTTTAVPGNFTPSPPSNGSSSGATSIPVTAAPPSGSGSLALGPTTGAPFQFDSGSSGYHTAPPQVTAAPPGMTMPPITTDLRGRVYLDSILNDGSITERSVNISLLANAEFNPTRCAIPGVVKFAWDRSPLCDVSFITTAQVFCDRWRMAVIFPYSPLASCGQDVTVRIILGDALTLNRTLDLTFSVIAIGLSATVEKAQATASNTAVAVSAAGGTTANEMQGMALVGMVSCADSRTKGSLKGARSVMCPWKLGDEELGYITGNVVILLILCTAATLPTLVFFLKYRNDRKNGVLPQPVEFPDPTAEEGDIEPLQAAQNMVGTPGRYIGFMALAHQGICFEAHLRLHDPDRTPLGLMVGIAGMLYGIAVPIGIGYWLKRKFRAKYCEYKYLSQVIPFGVRLFTPKAFWLPINYAKRNGAMFEEVGPTNVWFALYDPFIKCNIVAAVAAFQLSPGPPCQAQYGILTAVYGLEAIARIVRWPHRTLVSNLSPLAACITTTLLACSAGFSFSLLSTEIAMVTQSYLSIICGVLSVAIKMVDQLVFQRKEIRLRYENADFEFVDTAPGAKEEEEMKEKSKDGEKADRETPLLVTPDSKEKKKASSGKPKSRRGKGEGSSSSGSDDDDEEEIDQVASPLVKLKEKGKKGGVAVGAGSALDMLLQFKSEVKEADEKESKKTPKQSKKDKERPAEEVSTGKANGKEKGSKKSDGKVKKDSDKKGGGGSSKRKKKGSLNHDSDSDL